MKRVSKKVDDQGNVWEYFHDKLERVIIFLNGNLESVIQEGETVFFYENQTSRIKSFRKI